MEFFRLLRVFKNNKFRIALVTALFLFGGLILSIFTVPRMYQAKAVLMVSGREDSASGQVDYMAVLTSRQMVKPFITLISGNTVLNGVARELDFDVTVGKLRNAVRVKPIDETELMEIRVMFPDPQQAAQIANKTAEVFSGHIAGLFPFTDVVLVEPATRNWIPVQPKILLNTVVSVLIGFTLVVTCCLLDDFIRQPVRGKEEVEALSIQFLGRIPAIKNLKTLVQNEFWNLQTLLKLHGPGRKVLITGVAEEAGKSTVCTGLALCLVQSGIKVTLIDAGSVGPGHYRFLASAAFREFFTAAAGGAEIILIDGPSLMDDAGALLLATMADSVLLVVKAGTPGGKLIEALQRLHSARARVIGVVINENPK